MSSSSLSSSSSSSSGKGKGKGKGEGRLSLQVCEWFKVAKWAPSAIATLGYNQQEVSWSSSAVQMCVSNDRLFLGTGNIIHIGDLHGNWQQHFAVLNYLDAIWVDSKWLRGGGRNVYPSLQGLAVTGQEIFFSECVNECICVLNTEGKLQRQWGAKGTGDGQFQAVGSIAIADDLLYVCDRGNQRVQVFDLQGNFIRKFGRNDVIDIDVAHEHVFLSTKDSVAVCKTTGELVARWATSPHQDLAVWKNLLLTCGGTSAGRLEVITLEGKLLCASIQDDLRRVCVHGERMYVADSKDVYVYLLKNAPETVPLPPFLAPATNSSASVSSSSSSTSSSVDPEEEQGQQNGSVNDAANDNANKKKRSHAQAKGKGKGKSKSEAKSKKKSSESDVEEDASEANAMDFDETVNEKKVHFSITDTHGDAEDTAAMEEEKKEESDDEDNVERAAGKRNARATKKAKRATTEQNAAIVRKSSRLARK